MAYFDMEQLDDAANGVTQPMLLPRARKLVNAGNTVTPTVQPGQALPMSLRARLGKVSEELDKLDSAEPDLTEWQNYAKQRGEEGQGAMMTALAAQFAGPQFEGLQAQLLRKAAAAQEPMKLGNALMTSNGQIIKDPYAARDQRRTGLERQYNALLTTIDRQEKAAQDRADRLAQQEWQNQFRTDQAHSTAQFRNDSLALRNLLAQNAAANNQNSQNSRTWQVEDRMLDDYEKAVKDPKQVLSAYSNLSATPRTAAGDVSFIYQYMKMLDPGSVVREGEFATAQNATGVPDRIRNLYNKVATGQRLNDQQRNEFLQTAGSLADVADQRIMAAQKQTSETAGRRNVDVRNIFAPHRPRNAATRNVNVDY